MKAKCIYSMKVFFSFYKTTMYFHKKITILKTEKVFSDCEIERYFYFSKLQGIFSFQNWKGIFRLCNRKIFSFFKTENYFQVVKLITIVITTFAGSWLPLQVTLLMSVSDYSELGLMAPITRATRPNNFQTLWWQGKFMFGLRQCIAYPGCIMDKSIWQENAMNFLLNGQKIYLKISTSSQKNVASS